jgi:predicted ATPase/DNA-binding SARP family transcriptional activator
VEVRLLGQLEAVADDGAPVVIRGVKLRTLVAILALHRGEPVGTDRLIGELWGDAPPGNPVNALQASVSQLRRAFGAAKIVTSEAGYALGIAPEDLDVVHFERLVAEGRRQLIAGDAAMASRTLHTALALCRDEALVEFAYAEFALGERARLEELALAAVEARIEADLALGRHGDVTGELEALCQRHPMRERLWELSMLALYRSGRQADALRAFAEARTALVEELGLDPGSGLKELEARVLAQDPSLDAPAGDRRATVSASPAGGNLRARLTTFVGRDDDLARLVDVTRTRRLVTLIGPGGAGKTRLAVETAAALQPEYRDGAWLVELGAVRDTEAVAPAIAAALEARGPGPAEAAAPALGLLVGHLRGRSLVIVLDNCEHVVAEAATVVEALLGEVPDLLVIATSREPLGVGGEALFPIGGLDADAAVELFADRGSAVRPSFSVDADTRPVVAELCRRLDHLPLAVELAAARLRVLPLAQLVGLLDDRFRVLTGGSRTALPRHQTLRAVVDWSHDLLFDDERRLFARLSVFTGGCGLEAVESVCSDDALDRADILDLLGRLVDKSLVVAEFGELGEVRYSQLQTLWEYGRERLAASGEAASVFDRHAQWYMALSLGVRQGFHGQHGLVWRARIAAEIGNLRGALDWYIERGDATAALSLTTGLACWFQRGDFLQAAGWLEEALRVDGEAPVTLRAAAAAWHGYFNFNAWITAPVAALAEVGQAVEVLRDGSDLERLGDALLVFAALLNRNGDLDTTRVVLAEARLVLTAADDRWGLATHDLIYAQHLASVGQLGAAEASARASVEGFQAIGEQFLFVECLAVLAGVAEARGDLESAAVTYEQLLERARADGLAYYVPHWLTRLGALRARQQDDTTAEQLFAEAVTRSDGPMRRGAALIGLAGATRRRGDLESARDWLEQAAAEYGSVGHDSGRAAVSVARCWWAIAAGDLDAAAGFADQACRAVSHHEASMRMSAQIAAAAVAAVRSGSEADIERFAALVDQHNGSDAGRFAAVSVGAIGSTLDEPDVAALYRTLGLDAAPTPR